MGLGQCVGGVGKAPSTMTAVDNPQQEYSSQFRPRVGLVVVDDGLYTHRWVVPLLADKRVEVVCVACLSPFTAVDFNPGDVRGLWRVSWKRLAYYGLAATIRFAHKAALANLADQAFCLGLGRSPQSVTSAVRARGLSVLRPPHDDVNHPDFVSCLAAHRPDLLLCVFSQLAEADFLAVPRIGCLNVHFSLLPHHRGREPLFHAMLAGEGAGVSIHWMSQQLDAGAVVLQSPLDITRFRTLHAAILGATEQATQLVPQALLRAAAACPSKERISGHLPPLQTWPTGKEVAAFRRQGFRFI